MQFLEVLALAFAATAVAGPVASRSVHDDDITVADSVSSTVASLTLVPVVDTSAKRGLEARDWSVVMCEHANFQGACVTWSPISSGTCYGLPAGWNDRVSSMDTNGLTCTIWEHSGCRGDSSTNNGRVNFGYMNDKASSWYCI